MEDKTSLAERKTVVELVATYDREIARIRAALVELEASQDTLVKAFAQGDSHRSFMLRDRHNRVFYFDLGDIIAHLKRDAWGVLVDRLEIRRMMSIKRRNQLDEQLEKGELPELTVESVFAMARGFEEQLPDMLGEAVEEVFEWLRPRSSQYKTNTELEIGRKVILSWVIDDMWRYASKFSVNYRFEPELTALENVFRALDGQGQRTRTHHSDLSNAIKATPIDVGRGETTYFRFRCFRNCNLHLEFKRLDLLERFNAIAGGRRLRPKVA